MTMYKVKVMVMHEIRIGVIDIMNNGDIIKSWSYNNLDDCKRQFRRVVKGLELHGKIMAYNDEYQDEDVIIMSAKTKPINEKSLWITLIKEEVKEEA